MQPVDLNAVGDLNAPTQLPLGLDQITGYIPVLQEAWNNLMANTTPAEWGLIVLLAGLAFLFLRANFWVQMLLKFAALLFIVIIFAILFGVINL